MPPPACSRNARTAAARTSITPGLCLRPGSDECQCCGRTDRLYEVSRVDTADQLPTADEDDEGQWFLRWPDEQRGPYPSARAAWDDWHASSHG